MFFICNRRYTNSRWWWWWWYKGDPKF